MLPNLGYGELLIILVLALLLFGAKQVPEVARNTGRSLPAFTAGLKDGLDDPAKPAKEESEKK